jgi:hypothetical protein
MSLFSKSGPPRPRDAKFFLSASNGERIKGEVSNQKSICSFAPWWWSNLFAETLDELCRMDSAYEKNPGVTL